MDKQNLNHILLIISIIVLTISFIASFYTIYILSSKTIEINKLEKKYETQFYAAINSAKNIKIKSSDKNSKLNLDLSKWPEIQEKNNIKIISSDKNSKLNLDLSKWPELKKK